MPRPSHLIPLAALVMLGACAGTPTEGQLWGTGAGAATGAGIGRAAAIGTHYPWAFTGVGVVAGAALGYAVGDTVDPEVQRLWSAATIKAAEEARPGQAVAWEGRGRRGSVTMEGPAWEDSGGRPCRALRQEASRMGDDPTPYIRNVIACRFADGTWEVMEPLPFPEPAPHSPA